MENRRPPTNTATPLNRNKNLRNEGDRSAEYGRSQNRDRNFQPRSERSQKPDGFQPRDGRFVRRDGKLPPGNDRFPPKGRFTPRGGTIPPWKKEIDIRIVSDMQVTDGKHKGKYLKSSTSTKVLPTSRRIREVMFRILFRRIRGKRFLDLCAGCGTVGIEAISRGATVSTLVERSSKMCSFIKENLKTFGIKTGHGEVVEMEAAPFLKKMSKRRRFWDVVYFDSPHDAEYEEILKYFGRGASIAPGGVLVIEHFSTKLFPEKIGILRRFRAVVQGEATISFYERK